MSIPNQFHREGRSEPLDGRHLRTFQSVAAELSFTRAAVALGYVQSSVTAQIQALERDLGVKLFERLGRRVTLTDAGRRLLGYADQILALNTEARASVNGDAMQGRLVIGAPDSLCAYRLPAVVRALRQDFPQVQVVFRSTRSCRDAREAVFEGQVDAAVMLDDEVDDRRLVTTLLAPEPLGVLVAHDHPLAALEQVDVQTLRGWPAVLTEAGCGYRTLFDRRLHAAGVPLGTVIEFASLEAIKECVKAGMGVTVLPLVAARRELRDRELVVLPWCDAPLQITTQMVYHPNKWIRPVLRAFLLNASNESRQPAPSLAK